MSSAAAGPFIVLSPEGLPVRGAVAEQASGLAPRLVDLAGRVVGIIDDGLPGADRYLHGVGDLLAAAYPGLQVRHWRKPALSRPAPPALIEAVANACDGVIVGVCG
jgi:hypothetical protein